MAFNIDDIRSDFPILHTKVHDKPLVYFDNAATTQKPTAMIQALTDFYQTKNSNVHRGIHELSQQATLAFDSTRTTVAEYCNCSFEEVIFTKNDTESINLLAFSFDASIADGANIVLTKSEHHSNIVPWQLLQKRCAAQGKNIELRYAELENTGHINTDSLLSLIDSKTFITSFVWASNTFGVLHDARSLIARIRERSSAYVIVDAAQALAHTKLDFRNMDADFVTFSAHKIFGPTGVGVLIGKRTLLEILPPFLGGGDMIKTVTVDGSTFAELPYKFEAGTPNIADVVAFKASLEYVEHLGHENIVEYENSLTEYLLESLEKLEFVEIYGAHIKDFQDMEKMNARKLPLVSYNIHGVHAHDVGSMLDEDGIAVRAGHHCTQPAMQVLGIPTSVRASLCFYNTKEEISMFIESLKHVHSIFA